VKRCKVENTHKKQEKMSEALQGRTRTEETRKMSEAHKGKNLFRINQS